MAQKKTKPALRILAIDVGRTNVKLLATGQTGRRKLPSGKELKQAPPGSRLGSNDNAFIGGYRLWDEEHAGTRAPDPAGARDDRAGES